MRTYLNKEQVLTGTWVMDEVSLAVEKVTVYSRYIGSTNSKSRNKTPKQARWDFRRLHKYIFEVESRGERLSRLGP